MRDRVLQLVIFSLILITVAACGRGATTTETPHDPNAPPPPRPQDFTVGVNGQSDDRLGNLHAPVDLGGRIITVATLREDVLSIMMPPSVRGEPNPEFSNNYARDRAIWNNARRVEYMFNFTIEEDIQRGDVRMGHLLRTSVAAGAPFADIVLTPPHLILEASLNNTIQPLDLIELPQSDLLGLQIHSRFTAEGFGHAWAFASTAPTSEAFTVAANLNLIAAVGASNPVELYNSGNWTWETMLEIMRHVSADAAGDEDAEQWGLIAVPHLLLFNLVGANDGMFVTEDLRSGLSHPHTIEAMAFLETLLQERHIRPNERWNRTDHGFGIWDDMWSLTEANAAFVTGMFWTPHVLRGGYSIFPFEYAILPLPVGPSNTSGNTGMAGWQEGLVLPMSSGFEAAELLMVMEEYFSWAGAEPDRIQDIPTRWFNNIPLEGENAVRHRNAMHSNNLDIAYMIPGIDFTMEFLMAQSSLNYMIRGFTHPPHPDRENWPRHSPEEAAVIYTERMQYVLDSFFE